MFSETDATLVIKTFERPHSVRLLWRSIRARYPTVPIVIVDDSREPLTDAFDAATRLVVLPRRTGLSAGRNAGIAAVHTRYAMILDDDYVFCSATSLERLHACILRYPFALSCPTVVNADPETGRLAKFYNPAGSFRHEGETTVLDNRRALGRFGDLPIYTYVSNCCYGPTRFFRDNPWDERMRWGEEHVDFFLRAFEVPKIYTVDPRSILFHLKRKPSAYQAEIVRERQRSGAFENAWGGRYRSARKRSGPLEPLLRRVALERLRRSHQGELSALMAAAASG